MSHLMTALVAVTSVVLATAGYVLVVNDAPLTVWTIWFAGVLAHSVGVAGWWYGE